MGLGLMPACTSLYTVNTFWSGFSYTVLSQQAMQQVSQQRVAGPYEVSNVTAVPDVDINDSIITIIIISLQHLECIHDHCKVVPMNLVGSTSNGGLPSQLRQHLAS